MSHMTNLMENRLLDFLFRGQALNAGAPSIATATATAGGLTTMWLALMTVTPSDTGGGTEVATLNTNYARVSLACSTSVWSGTQGAPSTTASSGTTGTIANNAAINFNAPSGSANWGTINGIGFYDSATVGAGNLLFWAPLQAAKTVNAGDAAPSFPIGALTIQIDTD
jgi:hypothetical protein